MMTINDLCKCFEGFSDDSRILTHFANGETVMRNWKDWCHACYPVKRFAVVCIINDIIVLEIWN